MAEPLSSIPLAEAAVGSNIWCKTIRVPNDALVKLEGHTYGTDSLKYTMFRSKFRLLNFDYPII